MLKNVNQKHILLERTRNSYGVYILEKNMVCVGQFVFSKLDIIIVFVKDDDFKHAFVFAFSLCIY